MNELFLVGKSFLIEGDITSVEPYGCGHINVTYLLTTTKRRYILQKINDQLFTDVNALMENINAVTSYLKNNYPNKTTLTLVYTLDGKSYYHDASGYYRVYEFIENSLCLQLVTEDRDFYASAVMFGEFAQMLNSFDASILHELIPNFHNTPARFTQLEQAIKTNYQNRLNEVTPEVEFVFNHKDYLSTITSLLDNKQIPLKVTHNDTKLNNVLLDEVTHQGLAVIDLDTVMPGTILYDFGDSIRFGCNSSTEDETDLSKVNFQIHLFEVYVKGYLSALGKSITVLEKDHLVDGAILMTLECGMRFLSDYLSGDTYFKIHRPQHNLDRCRTQFKLVRDMESVKSQMEEIVQKYYQIYCR